jgi:hypothetical protein
MSLFSRTKPEQQMTITPKFKINDLLQHKFSQKAPIPAEMISLMNFFEILYIQTETCSAGTQIFYKCRSMGPSFKHNYKDEPTLQDIHFGLSKDNSGNGYVVFREDEVIPMSEEAKKAYKII